MTSNALELIRPTQLLHVMDLVEQAGIDVSDWANFKGRYPATNPKYCYEWAFVDREKVVVLNLWFDGMAIDPAGHIFHQLNYRKLAVAIETNGRNPIWAARARRLDMAVMDALRLQLPIRVIVNQGQPREIELDGESSSKVEKRMLDPEPWVISSYDMMTGECVLTRGLAPCFIDQFSMPEPEGDDSPERVKKFGTVFPRDPQVRQFVLTRAAGHCEYCGAIGFNTASGGIYLETHHVVALALGGPDTVANVAALCPGHHREAHYGAERDLIREFLQKRAGTH
jgi:5-methylcytosine-specific restriction protein A